MATNVSGSGGRTQKPQQWNLDPAYVAPEWKWFWEDLTILIPCMEGGGRPMFYLKGNPVVPILTDGRPVADATGSGYEELYRWERNAHGWHITGSFGAEYTGYFFVTNPVSHSINGNEYFNWENHGPFSVTTYAMPHQSNFGTSGTPWNSSFGWTRSGSVGQDHCAGPCYLNNAGGNDNRLAYSVAFGPTLYEMTSSVRWPNYPDFKERPILSGITSSTRRSKNLCRRGFK